ncbi:MAG TPA: shikimate dehydrogenase [Candidatus Didemnitutus sp.]|nr:shikimate dehydrogenase [Candidatus Didemnitutus sp.]
MSVPAFPVYTLADLEIWSAPGTSLGLLGHPVAHSLSPAIHNAALAALAKQDARFGAWRYSKFDIAPAELGRALKLFHQKGFVGLNLTVPHKEMAFEHAEVSDALASAASATNTLIRTPTGWRASNTDSGGLADALRAELGVDLCGANVILLGAGGAARAAAAQCLREKTTSLWIGNRGVERLQALLDHLAPLAGNVPVRGFSLANPPPDLPAGSVVINTTSAGLKGDGSAPIDLRRIPAPGNVYDMIYNPPLTPLLTQASALGIPHAHGLGMLVNQGARSLSMWIERPAPLDVMTAAAHEAFAALSHA